MYAAKHTKILMRFEEVISSECHNHFYFSLQYPSIDKIPINHWMIEGYDIIGDIHGQADKLESLLHKMRYRINSDGVYAHSNRLANSFRMFTDDILKNPEAKFR